MQLKTLVVSALILLLLAGCRKDQLRPVQVTRIPYNNAETRFNRVLFTDSIHGYIVGGQRFDDAVMLTTGDGGATWTEQHFPMAAKGLYDITRSPGGVLYTIGFDGKLLRSTDAGGNWNFSQTEYYSFTGIAFPTPDTGLVIGGISFREGKLMKVTAAGEAAGSSRFSWQLNKIHMVNAQLGYICGFGAFMKTTDGGRSWQLQQVAGDNFRDICVIGEEIWLCGDAGSIFHTYDGGRNWQRYRNGNDITLPHYHLTSIVFADRLNGWATGEQGLLLKTEDGGQHWMEYKPFTGNALRHLSIMRDGSLLVVGDGGGVYRVSVQ